jgi:hypothetical protein
VHRRHGGLRRRQDRLGLVPRGVGGRAGAQAGAVLGEQGGDVAAEGGDGAALPRLEGRAEGEEQAGGVGAAEEGDGVDRGDGLREGG